MSPKSVSLAALPSNEAALDAIRPVLDSMPEEDIDRDARVNATAAAATAEAAAGKLSRFKAEIILLCGEIAGARIDRLPIYARALAQAAVEAKAAATSGDLSELHAKAREHHSLVLTELDSLANRGVLDPALLAPARPVQGYEETIQSTKVGVYVARQNWAAIEGKTQLTKAMLDGAIAAAERLERAIIDRDHGVTRAPAIETRTRALSLLLAEYDEVRRIATYFRWHQRDYDAFAPSVFAGRTRRSASDEPEGGDAPVTPPVTPSPNNGGGPFTE